MADMELGARHRHLVLSTRVTSAAAAAAATTGTAVVEGENAADQALLGGGGVVVGGDGGSGGAVGTGDAGASDGEKVSSGQTETDVTAPKRYQTSQEKTK